MKNDNRVRKKVENIVERMGYRSDKAAPVEPFWDTPETDTCFDILVLTYSACYQPPTFLRPSGAPDRLAI